MNSLPDSKPEGPDEGETTGGNEAAESPTAEKVFAVEVLQVIRDAQQRHGLRHGDYHRYRSYCARHIQRMRKSLKFAQGTRNRVQPKKITVALMNDVRYLHLLLASAERAWAYAMQLKAEANTEPRKKFHLRSRLYKAVQYADAFNSLSKSTNTDARTKLEAQAYAVWMQATLEFELESWPKSLEHLTEAKTIYEKLAEAFSSDLKLIYTQKAEEIVPSIRYCAYNIGDTSAIDDLVKLRLQSGAGDELTSKLDALIAQTREKQASTLGEVSWQGRTVPVKNEVVRVFLMSLKESEKNIEAAQSMDSAMSIYDVILKDCVDAQNSLREELKSDPTFTDAVSKHGADMHANSFVRVSNPHYLYSYLTYIRLTKTIQRNQALIVWHEEKLSAQDAGIKDAQDAVKDGPQSKPQDLVRLCDIIIQNLQEIPQLSGVQDSSELAEEVAVQITCYRAYRCFHMAKYNMANKKYVETVALLGRAAEYTRSALDAYDEYATHGFQPTLLRKEAEKLNVLLKEIDALKFSAHAASVMDIETLQEEMSEVTFSSAKPLAERLETYSEDTALASKKGNLVSFPPDFTPIPAKPLFFDLALNHVTFPSLEDKVEQKKRGGFTGLVSGWLWGSKS